MPVEVDWDDQLSGVFYWRYTGAWTWREWDRAWHKGARMLDSASEPIYGIIDFRGSTLFPADLLANIRRYFAPQDVHPNSALYMVLIGVDMWLERLFRTINRLFVPHVTAAYARDEHEARALIRAERHRRAAHKR